MAKSLRFEIPGQPPNPDPKPVYEPPVYLCIGCGEYATYGMGVNLRKDIEGFWYCGGCVPPEFFDREERDK